MSILIPGMKLPKAGYCFIVFHDGEVWGDGKRIGKVGTAIELPPHGRLGDLDALMLRVDCHGTNKFGMLDEDIREFIGCAPTIIPAEEE